MRRVGLVGSGILLLLAIGVLTPAAAFSAPSFKATTYPATIHGSASVGSEKITMEGGAIECATAYHGELKEASTTSTLAPTYKECKAFSFVNATVHSNGCKYLLHAAEEIALDKYAASFDITCEAGKAIEVTAGTCKVTIPAQSGLGGVELINDTEATPKRDITFDPEVGGIAYTVVSDGFSCPFNGIGAKANASFTSSGTTLTGQHPSSPEAKIGVEVG